MHAKLLFRWNFMYAIFKWVDKFKLLVYTVIYAILLYFFGRRAVRKYLILALFNLCFAYMCCAMIWFAFYVVFSCSLLLLGSFVCSIVFCCLLAVPSVDSLQCFYMHASANRKICLNKNTQCLPTEWESKNEKITYTDVIVCNSRSSRAKSLNITGTSAFG